MAVYDIGDRVKVYTSTPFTDSDGVIVDPDIVTFRIKEPDGTVTPYVYDDDPEVVKDGVGIYYILVNVDAHGNWYYRIEGTDAGLNYMGADEGNFTARVSYVL
jgi:hypothetical protein